MVATDEWHCLWKAGVFRVGTLVSDVKSRYSLVVMASPYLLKLWDLRVVDLAHLSLRFDRGAFRYATVCDFGAFMYHEYRLCLEVGAECCLTLEVASVLLFDDWILKGCLSSLPAGMLFRVAKEHYELPVRKNARVLDLITAILDHLGPTEAVREAVILAAQKRLAQRRGKQKAAAAADGDDDADADSDGAPAAAEDCGHLEDAAAFLDPVLMAAVPQLAIELAHDYHFLTGSLSNGRVAHGEDDGELQMFLGQSKAQPGPSSGRTPASWSAGPSSNPVGTGGNAGKRGPDAQPRAEPTARMPRPAEEEQSPLPEGCRLRQLNFPNKAPAWMAELPKGVSYLGNSAASRSWSVPLFPKAGRTELQAKREVHQWLLDAALAGALDDVALAPKRQR